MKIPAPIALFVYNRPWHTEKTLKALSKNYLANKSELFIFADGPKENASKYDLKKISKVRDLITVKEWCNKVHIFKSEYNKGLSASVIDGVNTVLSNNDRIIVLEDDIVTATGFLKFINGALDMYRDDDKVAGVSGWVFKEKFKDNTFFSSVGSCWGWGTFERVWSEAIFDAELLRNAIKQSNKIHEFNVNGSYNYFSMLEKQLHGLVDSWAVRFYASYFLRNQLFLFPKTSLAMNIGVDGSGVHYNKRNRFFFKSNSFINQFIDVDKIEKMEKPENYYLIQKSFLNNRNNFLHKVKQLLHLFRG